MIHKIFMLDSVQIQKLFTMKDAVKVTEKAFKDFTLGKARMPSKVYLDLPEYKGDFRAMPAAMSSPALAGVKWVNSHPENPKKGFPAVMAMMIVNDAKTAAPLAVMDATLITSLRTGAAGAIAIKYLAPKNSKKLSVMGAGNQAYFQILGALSVMPRIQTISFYDPSPKSMKELEKKIRPLFKGEIIQAVSAEACVQNCDILVTTTPSRKPVILNSWIQKGVHINAIGADAPGKQELESALLKRAKVVVDDREQASHSGEINVPLHNGEIDSSIIFSTLGESIINKNVRSSEDDITIFDSTGLAIQDLYAAGFIIQKAKKTTQIKGISFKTG